MTILHTVVFRLTHQPGSEAEADFLRTARRELSAIPGVTDFTIRRQVSPKSGMAWQFSMAFADQGVYDAYNGHPVHTGFVQSRWAVEVAEFQEYDFTTLRT